MQSHLVQSLHGKMCAQEEIIKQSLRVRYFYEYTLAMKFNSYSIKQIFSKPIKI